MAPRVRKAGIPPSEPSPPVADYRFDAARKNIPPAGLAAQGKLAEPRRIRYDYDPHRPPLLRFDASGKADRLPELLEAAQKRALTEEEAHSLAEALRDRQPWLEWAGKREQRSFEVEPVALHIHERIAAQAIVKVAARQDVQRDLFADPQLSYREAVQFYQHDIDWANRMILGDSLQVMASLARRENVAGRVQMIYIDPPYGIKFASNFQPEVGKRDVKDKESDLTREPEMVKAYRDTWTLGVHSYLAYLRDRLMVAKELLADSGSIFVQISDENLHRVRCVMDEVFGAENFVSLISFQTTSGFAESGGLSRMGDYLLWYGKNREQTKICTLYECQEIRPGATNAAWLVTVDGDYRGVTSAEEDGREFLPKDSRLYSPDNFVSQGIASTPQPFEFQGQAYEPGGNNHWKPNYPIGLHRLANSGRIHVARNSIRYRRYADDFPLKARGNLWTDTLTGSFTDAKLYVVQTNPKVIERCLLMTTDPGDLVLDPTCGSGTTAYVAEQWGRRWITIDTSRVALALARQRLITARFDYYQLRPVNEEDLRRNSNGAWLASPDSPPQLRGGGATRRGGLSTTDAGPDHPGADAPLLLFKEGNRKFTLDCETVPHITLKSIAQNAALDPIFAKHQPVLDEKLAALNAALVGCENLRAKLAAKLAIKEKTEGKKAVTEADRRRWLLPPAHRDPKLKLTVDARFAGWYEWEVPFDADPDWPEALQTALTDYRAAWRAKMDAVNAAIAANADNEELVDKPRIRRNVTRVSGPFTVEAVIPAEQNLHDDSPIEGVADELAGFDDAAPKTAEAFLDRMIRLLAQDGVRFPNNKTAAFSRLSPIGEDFLHAEGEWSNDDGQPCQVAVTIGPECGPVTAWQVENALTQAYRRRVYEDLVVAGFSFDAAAQALIQDDPNPQVRCHLAHIRPDVNMGGLLKDTPNAQLFTVFGSPRTRLEQTPDGLFTVTLEGVDIYNPVDNAILATRIDKVAAWFVDSDYDGQIFCITQAFFPDKSAWDKLARALKTIVDESAFAALSGAVSLPFAAGPNRRVAVKVIDPRGNEVMRVHRLGRFEPYRSS
ncbi:MAG: site-specific DNA-methyltransferase [Candidatus Contendobacter sp.]|nr:site-specific DNA-methyltransferase [Candidatus Contendobacter sp.]MDS4059205.1 site-specific DNA-methyltransferase [Candidatus Contendobacter sp.]